MPTCCTAWPGTNSRWEAFRFLLGLTEPGSFPAAVKAVREWFAPEQRAIGVGVFNAGSALGSAVSAPLERGFDSAMIGRYAWVPYVFGGFGYILGGWLSGRLMRAGWSLRQARMAVLAAGAALLPTAILAPLVPNCGLGIAPTCLVVFGHGIWIANLLTLPADLFPAGAVGTASGLSGMGGSVGGIITNMATGYAVSHFSHLAVFIWAGVMHPISMLMVWGLLPARVFEPRENI